MPILGECEGQISAIFLRYDSQKAVRTAKVDKVGIKEKRHPGMLGTFIHAVVFGLRGVDLWS